MSRSGYTESYCGTEWDVICWRGAVSSAIRGKRGQAFLRDLLAALDALPEKKLIAGVLEEGDNVCAIGALGRARGIDMGPIDPEDHYIIARVFDIANALAREVLYENDEHYAIETPEARFERMRDWVNKCLTR